ncbi:MAG: hypothetical protein MUF72_08935 [Elainella sp. Prado103]|jgi:hypothetical protein|nr:hypothetical protein [Elainella sp. Prado103]
MNINLGYIVRHTTIALFGAVILPLGLWITSAKAESFEPDTSRSASDLTNQPLVPAARDSSSTDSSSTDSSSTDSSSTDSSSTDSSSTVAQSPVAQEIIPGRATRSGSSYIGVAGNIGLGGETALGRGNFTVISKIGLTPRFSARPSVVIGSDPTILVPVTADFPIEPINDEIDLAVAPYVGGGVAISTGSDSLVRPVITGGIDVPIANRVTATAQANVAFFEDTEAGLILGIGYNF